MLDVIVRENKIIFLLGNFNVNLSQNVELSLDAEEFKNIFYSHHLFPLINKPTRVTNHTATVIDNIFLQCSFAVRYYVMWAFSVHILVITMVFFV